MRWRIRIQLEVAGPVLIFFNASSASSFPVDAACRVSKLLAGYERVPSIERCVARLTNENEVLRDPVPFLGHKVEVELVSFVCDDVGEVESSL